MDLSFPRPTAEDDASLPAADMAWLVAMLGARLGASATARTQAGLDEAPAGDPAGTLLAPADGAFNGAMAARLAAWGHP